MNTFWILMEQIELFIVYLVIGVILVRTGVLSDKGLDWIARVVMKLSQCGQSDRPGGTGKIAVHHRTGGDSLDSLIWTGRCVDKTVSCRR